jgi:hypothetical protein
MRQTGDRRSIGEKTTCAERIYFTGIERLAWVKELEEGGLLLAEGEG